MYLFIRTFALRMGESNDISQMLALLTIKSHSKCGFKMGSDVYGLPSQETYLDSQNFHSDAAKIGIILELSKFSETFF